MWITKAVSFSIPQHIERKEDFDSEVVDDIMKFEDSP
jgi:hypothetical protein